MLYWFELRARARSSLANLARVRRSQAPPDFESRAEICIGSVVIAVAVVVPVIVSIPVTVRTPLVTLWIVPAMVFVPAALPFRIQFRPGIVCLPAVLAMFMGLVAIMFLGFLYAMLTS